jgi:hypothetical protein
VTPEGTAWAGGYFAAESFTFTEVTQSLTPSVHSAVGIDLHGGVAAGSVAFTKSARFDLPATKPTRR